jgi:hypothetical protein
MEYWALRLREIKRVWPREVWINLHSHLIRLLQQL